MYLRLQAFLSLSREVWGRVLAKCILTANHPTLREELKSLEGKLTQSKQRYQQSLTQAQGANSSSLSALPPLNVNDRFLLNQDEAWYTLSIEIQVPIDHVMLQVCAC